MRIDEIASRVSSLKEMLLVVLDQMSQGLSNRQIAVKLGYRNPQVVATYVYMINKALGLTKIKSMQEKRHLAVEAFRKSRVSLGKARVSIRSNATVEWNTIRISKEAADEIRSLLTKDYNIEAIELRATARSIRGPRARRRQL